MGKIMFNDKYELTKAVLEGRKTMTRRTVPEKVMKGAYEYMQKVNGNGNDIKDYLLEHARYKVGEVVAVAQSYKDIAEGLYVDDEMWKLDFIRRVEDTHELLQSDIEGWNNKMFVLADLMPHQIRITNVLMERLQDISEEDVYKEGFSKVNVNNGWGNCASHWEAMLVYYDNIGRTKEIRSQDAKEAFAALIDKVSGKGTFESNPWVFVYEFELV